MTIATIRATALAFIIAVGIPVAAFAHTMPIKKSGTLVDVICSSEVKTQADADKHTRDCALMGDCVKSGYGIVIDGVFHKFDAVGNRQAEAIFRNSKKTDHITATVDGTLQHEGDITVTKLTAE